MTYFLFLFLSGHWRRNTSSSLPKKTRWRKRGRTFGAVSAGVLDGVGPLPWDGGGGLMSLTVCPFQLTMETLLALGLHKQTEQLYRDFKVPDKRWVIWPFSTSVICWGALTKRSMYAGTTWFSWEEPTTSNKSSGIDQFFFLTLRCMILTMKWPLILTSWQNTLTFLKENFLQSF